MTPFFHSSLKITSGEISAKEAAEAEIVEETEENTGAEDFKEEEV